MNTPARKPRRFAMAIDIDRCTGCGACMVACAAENNVPPANPKATDRTGITPIRVFRIDNGQHAFEHRRVRYLPVTCMHCEHETPCQTVCPQQAVELDPLTGIVDQMPQRCLGCRYCMAACPYHARYFNWWDPSWLGGIEASLNPAVSPRMRGVVEKCNFCHARLHAAEDKAAAAGRPDIDMADYVPACVEACPTAAITFGDLADPASPVTELARDANSFRLLARLGTEPKVFYHSQEAWVRQLGERAGAAPPQEAANG